MKDLTVLMLLGILMFLLASCSTKADEARNVGIPAEIVLHSGDWVRYEGGVALRLRGTSSYIGLLNYYKLNPKDNKYYRTNVGDKPVTFPRVLIDNNTDMFTRKSDKLVYYVRGYKKYWLLEDSLGYYRHIKY